MSKSAIDPVLLEIIESSVQAASEEMFAAFRKTAMSPIIYEVLDMGTAITDRDGDLASAGAGVPAFVGVLDKAVKRVLELHGSEGVRPGDLFVTNDPFYGGVTHLNDIVLVRPVHIDAELMAWTATIAHWNDVGGMVPGSISTVATEIYQEGLRLPAVKVIDEGTPVSGVIEIMKANSRMPDFLHGDLWAGIAATGVGERRILELVEKYGREAFAEALRASMAYGERVVRHALERLPKGRFELAEEQDSGAVYKVAVEIDDEKCVIDLSDNPDQDSGPDNLARDGALIAAQMAWRNITGGEGGIANAGYFRPLHLITRPGSVFDPDPSAAVATYYEVEIRLYDLILRCLAPHLGQTLPAGNFSSVCGTYVSGAHPQTGRPFTIVEPEVGGWGASAWRDGNSAQFSGIHGDTFNCPAEVAEARYGLYVDQVAFNDEPGGEGRHRGGKGVVIDYRIRADGSFFTCAYTRSRHRPWPLAGGREGSSNYAEVIRVDGSVERYAVVTGVELKAGDVVRIHTANGAGYGDPRERSRELVREDLRNGFVDIETARAVYGFDEPVE
jgi:N-methylhydantoinase B